MPTKVKELVVVLHIKMFPYSNSSYELLKSKHSEVANEHVKVYTMHNGEGHDEKIYKWKNLVLLDININIKYSR